MAQPKTRASRIIESFDFHSGRILANKYEVLYHLGSGWEGDVYLVREAATGIERAAKFFFPHRNPRNRNLAFYARKLHKLRSCPILIQYQTHETIWYQGIRVAFLISDYVPGELLSDFLKRQPGERLDYFQALHLLHALTVGIEHIHEQREYHGDLHTENIILNRVGLEFQVKLIDMFHWGAATRFNIQDDVCDLIRIFYDALGGRRFYAKQPPEIKSIICGLKKTLILSKFNTAGKLRRYLEHMRWHTR
ncbi:MAG: protein kinase [Chitinivibrionales bacterium]|nr:protein kinase [Chitinivibrionales bacterium]MBD3357041.1 protein kinase [Chitinivibrionales bacterium]